MGMGNWPRGSPLVASLLLAAAASNAGHSSLILAIGVPTDARQWVGGPGIFGRGKKGEGGFGWM